MGNFFDKTNKSGPKTRTVTPNHTQPPDLAPNAKGHPNRTFKSNRIRTTKYSIITFIPKNLFEQFHRFANLYFIFVVCLNWVPQVAAFGKEIAMIPVIFVLLVTAIKDAYEDFRRYKSDKCINHKTCRVYKHHSSDGDERYVKTEWKDIYAGDIVHLSCDEIIPADILLLHSSDRAGLCHVETSNLDGETNLKQRQVVEGIDYQDKFKPEKFCYEVECDLPNAEIYKFTGYIKHGPDRKKKVPLNKDNLLLRGCTIRNTDFIEGMVVYGGHETKAMLNNRSPRYKRSKLERRINRDVIYCVVLLLLMCFLSAIMSAVWLGAFEDSTIVPFIPFESEEWYNPYFQGFVVFFTYIILFQTVIPLALYVSIELVKLGQVFFINYDLDLYYEKCDKRMECRALNITEDLGQIDYIFSDKTGTLTENEMEFKSCTIWGTDYPHAPEFDENIDDSETDSRYSIGTNISKSSSTMENLKIEPGLFREVMTMSLRSLTNVEVTVDSSGGRSTNYNEMEYQKSQKIQDFFLLMAICNTVVVTTHAHEDLMDESGIVHLSPEEEKQEKRLLKLNGKRNGNGNNPHLPPINTISSKVPVDSLKKPIHPPKLTDSWSFANGGSGGRDSPLRTPSEGSLAGSVYSDMAKIRFEAESPDELALVRAAATYGCCLKKRSHGKVTVHLPGEGAEVEFDLLHILSFDSTRKRMSVIVKHPMTKEIILLTKGADSQVLSVLDKKYKENEEYKKIVEDTEDHLYNYALQGLRTLCMAKRILHKKEYKRWKKKFLEAEAAMQDREQKIMDVACDIEKDFELLGATGIEDKLQDGVPETIKKLREAGINVWVLTGDKQETAIEIAHSSQLFDEDQLMIKLNANDKEETEAFLDHELGEIEKDKKQPRPSSARRRMGSTKSLRGVTQKMEYALVVDGKTLAFCLEKSLEKKFLRLTQMCKSVVCCRATPIQKGLVVKLVMDNLKKLSLAIGDGANDVSMIQTADVGVGISGQEGMQAVMASDFAISRFCFLQKLLLVHGHWCYTRLSRFSAFMFYKSLVTVFCIFWYQLYAGWSGAVQFDSIHLMFQHVLYTSLPPIINGILDRDLSAETLLQFPSIYRMGPEDQMYTRKSFFVAAFDSLYQSAILFYLNYLVYTDSVAGVWEFGTTQTVGLILIILFHNAVETFSWIWPQWLITILSFLVYWLFAIVINAIWFSFDHPSNPYWVMQNTMTQPIHFITVVLTLLTCLLPRFVVRVLHRTINPDEIVRAQLWEKEQEMIHLREMEERSLNEKDGNVASCSTSPDIIDKDTNDINGLTNNITDSNHTRQRDKDTHDINGLTNNIPDSNHTRQRNGDVTFRNGKSHVNSGYEHTEM
ncbi:phospholipid-transporting ATPase VD-like isoform X3 [Mytilus galloprovincialis]|uniref:phospholipid-transporting ATPase VD-like isoform X3 n=1 Tax=Mytilus galloprovincialis TaxID=29158 RepID=UPI003F7BABE3